MIFRVVPDPSWAIPLDSGWERRGFSSDSRGIQRDEVIITSGLFRRKTVWQWHAPREERSRQHRNLFAQLNYEPIRVGAQHETERERESLFKATRANAAAAGGHYFCVCVDHRRHTNLRG